VFPVRYELNFYILFRRNLVLKGLRTSSVKQLILGDWSESVLCTAEVN
jgi:hypothetical protein